MLYVTEFVWVIQMKNLEDNLHEYHNYSNNSPIF